MSIRSAPKANNVPQAPAAITRGQQCAAQQISVQFLPYGSNNLFAMSFGTYQWDGHGHQRHAASQPSCDRRLPR